MCLHMEKCSRVLLTLRAGLPPAAGDKGRTILARLYLDMFDGLRTAPRDADVEAAFDRVIGLARTLSDKMWAQARQELKSGA